MTAGTDYRGARDATIRAARDLYGTTSTACKTVVKTWAGVRVGAGLWACSGPLSGSGTNLLDNGGFEAGTAGWTASRGVVVADPPLARSGRRYAYLNGFGRANTQSARQTLTLPDAPKITLSYYLFIDSAERDAAAYDTLKVLAVKSSGGTVTLDNFSNRHWDGTYHRRTADLSSLRGQRITLTFVGTEDSDVPTGFLIDDVAIKRS